MKILEVWTFDQEIICFDDIRMVPLRSVLDISGKFLEKYAMQDAALLVNGNCIFLKMSNLFTTNLTSAELTLMSITIMFFYA